MTHQPTATPSDFDAVVGAIRRHDRFLVVTHENPDGDALGSMLGAALGAARARQGRVMHLAGTARYRPSTASCRSTRCVREPPADVERAGAAGRRLRERAAARPGSGAARRAQLVVDVDHHHDNTRFGAVNLVVADASSTAEIVRDLLRGLDVALTPEIAEALYVGLVTDTGRFQYTNTTPKALRLAAELVEAGADVHNVFKQVYETVQFAKLKLLARALERAQVYEGGRLVDLVPRAYRLRRGRSGRAVLGGDHRLPAPDRGRRARRADPRAAERGGPTHRISLRSSKDEIDVSAIARKSDGGGHRQAAGFSSEDSVEEIIEFIRREFVAAHRRARRAAMPPRASRPVGIALVDKPAGPSSFALVAELRRRTRRPDRAHGDARPVRQRAPRAVVRTGD